MFNKDQCEDMLNRGKKYLDEGKKLRDKIQNRALELSHEAAGLLKYIH